MVFLFLFLTLFFSCTKNTKEVVDVYARVGETILTSGITTSANTINVISTKGFPKEYGLFKINEEVIS